MLDIEASCKLKQADEGPCHGHVVPLQMQRVVEKTPPHVACSVLSALGGHANDLADSSACVWAPAAAYRAPEAA